MPGSALYLFSSFLASFVFIFPRARAAAVRSAASFSLLITELRAWAAVLFQSYPNTLFGFGVWSMLMRKHAAAELAPFTLLVPAVGMLCAAIILGEPLPPWKIVAGGVVLAGLAINQIAVRIQTWQRRPAPGG